jgi:copper chaperone CopZ
MKITLEQAVEPHFASRSLGVDLTPDTVPLLTTEERAVAMAEVSCAIQQTSENMNLARARAALPKTHTQHAPLDESWLNRAKRFLRCAVEIQRCLRGISGPDAPEVSSVEVEVRRKINSINRRHRRQQLQVDAFIDLIAEQIGEQAVEAFIAKAGAIADDRVDRPEWGAPFNRMDTTELD